jgi:dipeptidyl aminopeptidase/acylaminoacyl peptidase
MIFLIATQNSCIKKILLFPVIYWCLTCNMIFAQKKLNSEQKPPIDTLAFLQWTSVINPQISKDGKFITYGIENERQQKNDLVIRSLNGQWQTKINNVTAYSNQFTSDGRFLLYLKTADSLAIMNLRTKMTSYINKVTEFKNLASVNGSKIIFKSCDNNIVLMDLVSRSFICFENVEKYIVTKDQKELFIQRLISYDNAEIRQLSSVEIRTEKQKILWKGKSVRELTTNNEGMKLTFIEDVISADEHYHRLYFMTLKDTIPGIVATDRKLIKDSGLQFSAIQYLSNSGDRIFLNLKKIPSVKDRSEKLNFQVLNSKSLLIFPKNHERLISAYYNISNRKFIYLSENSENVRFLFNGNNDSLVVINYNRGNPEEASWNELAKPKNCLISSLSGKQEKISFNVTELSPVGNYVVGYDSNNNYTLHHLRSGKNTNIQSTFFEKNKIHALPIKTVAWFPFDSAILVSDGLDIWKIDPAIKSKPLCITNGYGNRENIYFQVAGHQIINNVIHYIDQNIIFVAFNNNTKESGFFTKALNNYGDPQLLNMGPYSYLGFSNYVFNYSKNIPFKPTSFIGLRGSASETPNCYFTKDFKYFKRISEVFPERQYNWIQTALIDFKNPDSTSNKAIIYMPENIDLSRKYPVIFYYYEQMTMDLHLFIKPEPSNGGLSISWLVSRGYIVCTPDIAYKSGEPGKSALNAVTGAYNQLKLYAWIDSNKVGLFGHSFGGYETNYIVSHTSIFTAACAASATSNMISSYGSLRSGVNMNGFVYETGQYRMFNSLWKNLGGYIKNSPIFQANKIATPLLLLSNKDDSSVPFSQGVELYMAMRKLDRPAWLLQYSKEGHTIDEWENAVDFTYKVTDFFDHYLKKIDMPKWMYTSYYSI